MKFSLLTLILVILTLLIGAANFLAGLGLVSFASPQYEYRAFAGPQMDRIGYLKLARDNGIEIGEEDRIKFPQEMREQLGIINMIPFTIAAIEADGWEFVSVIPLGMRVSQVPGRVQGQDMALAGHSSQSENIYLFRIRKGKKPAQVNVAPSPAKAAAETPVQSPSGS